VFEKINDLEKKFDDLSLRITDPSVIHNTAVYQKITRERAGLIPLVEAYRKYKKVTKEFDDNKLLLEENDEEIRKMAKEELIRLEQEKTVLSMYFGIGYHQPLNLEEIGEVIGLSKERVRQIKEKGLASLRSLEEARELAMAG
jgi:DNA-directed RNA polymerase specialized sigma subunit